MWLAGKPTVDLSGWVFTDTNDASEWDPVTDGDQIVINGGGLGMALTLTGSSSYDTITGGDAGNQIFGLAGDDLINGGSGSDTITGGLGVDVIHAGLGADTLVVSENESAAGETYDGGGGIDTLEIHTSADFTGSTMQSLEVLSLASSVVLTSNQLDLATDTPTGIAHDLSVTGGSDGDLITVNVMERCSRRSTCRGGCSRTRMTPTNGTL